MATDWLPNRPLWLWREPGRSYGRGLPDEWALNGERYEGAWMFQEICAQDDDSNIDAPLAGMLVIRVAAACIRHDRRGEDLDQEIADTMEYVDDLWLTPAERAALTRILLALHPLNPARACDQLLAASHVFLAHDLRAAARTFVELAYDCARRFALDDVAAAASLAIARLALLDECPRSTRLWRGRAAIFQRRSALERNIFARTEKDSGDGVTPE